MKNRFDSASRKVVKEMETCGDEAQGPHEPHECVLSKGHDGKHICHCGAEWSQDAALGGGDGMGEGR